jgi:hypothetical protein
VAQLYPQALGSVSSPLMTCRAVGVILFWSLGLHNDGIHRAPAFVRTVGGCSGLGMQLVGCERAEHADHISNSWISNARPGVALPSVTEEPSKPKAPSCK